MQYKYAEIADTVYFWFAANDTTGTAADGATPLYDVRLAGAASDAAPTASGTPTLLSHANYSNGLHEIAIDTTGYAAGEYAVFCTLTVSTVNPAGFCGSFKLRTAGTAALSTNAVTIAAGAVDSIVDEVIEGTYTMRQMLRMMAAALLGKISGGGTATITFRDTGDSANRIVATVDANGNRTAVTLTAT